MKIRLPENLSPRQAMRAAIPVLVLALVASVVTGREKPSQAPLQPASRIDARVSAKAAVDPELDLAGLARDQGSEQLAPAADPFARLSFAAPKPARAEGAAAPEAPAGPPALPFTYLGKMVEDGKVRVFLARGSESHTVLAGATLGEYRVDKVSDTQVRFTYLPMKSRHTLDIPPHGQ